MASQDRTVISAHKIDAPDYFAVTLSHIVIIVRPYSATAFAGLDQNKLI
jgi:hypothetical protein